VETRLHAVQTERAVDIPDFGRQKEPELASTLNDPVGLDDRPAAVMQSDVWQLSHVACARIRSSKGDNVEAMKLIVRDLAELYGGSIALGPSPLGGLRATLTLVSGLDVTPRVHHISISSAAGPTRHNA
jgi:hypothetical protein